MKCLVLAWVAYVSLLSTAAAQSTIFIVRHAEKADAMSIGQTSDSKDPDLSVTGYARADALAKMLKDGNITAIYATEYKRTQQTAAPLAKTSGISVTIIPGEETASLVAKLKATRGNALVVGHSNTIPEIIKSLSITTPVTLGENDYDDLFVVTLEPSPRLIQLHYR